MTQVFDDQYRLVGRKIRDVDALVDRLNAIHKSVDRRIAAVEGAASQLNDVSAQLQTYGTGLVQQEVGPIVAALKAAADLSALLTISVTDPTVVIGDGVKSVTIPAGYRKVWAPAAYLDIVDDDEPGRSILGKRLTWNAGTGLLTVQVISTSGSGAGSGTWIISPAAMAPTSGAIKADPTGLLAGTTVGSQLAEIATALAALQPSAGVPDAPYDADSAVPVNVRTLRRALHYAGTYIGVGRQADVAGDGVGGLLIGSGSPQGGGGAWLSSDGLGNWLRIQSSKPENPQELVIYGSASQGYARTVSGTNQITRLVGTPFTTAWIGRVIYFLRKRFLVAAVPNASTLSVTETSGAAVVFSSAETEAYQVFATTGSGKCSIVGDRVHWLSGDPFVPLFFTDFKFKIGSVERTVAEFISVTEYRLSAAPGNAVDVDFAFAGNVFDQVATLRVQLMQGSDEENLTLTAIAGQEFYGRHFAIRAQVGGTYGQARPIYIGAGAYGGYQPRDVVGIYPDGGPGGAYGSGYVALGGVQGLEALRVEAPSSMSTARNRLHIPAAPSGYRAAIRALGVDSAVGINLDAKGTGDFLVTQDFARTVFAATASPSAVNWLEVNASAASAPLLLSAKGSDTNVDIKMIPKGITGRLWLGPYTANGDAVVTGYMEVKDATGAIRKLAIIS